jgi:DNA-binding transcriptional LysR family regulator
LEEELGERLFERTQRKALLTPAGSLFLPYAASILEAADRARQEIREMGAQVRGKISLGALPTIAPYFLPELISSFRKKYSEVEMIIHEERTQQLLRGIEEHELDLALISDAPLHPNIKIQQLFSEELFLCLPAVHPLVRRQKVVADDLQDEKFILMQEGHCLGSQVRQFCHSKGVPAPDQLSECPNWHGARHGRGGARDLPNSRDGFAAPIQRQNHLPLPRWYQASTHACSGLVRTTKTKLLRRRIHKVRARSAAVFQMKTKVNRLIQPGSG